MTRAKAQTSAEAVQVNLDEIEKAMMRGDGEDAPEGQTRVRAAPRMPDARSPIRHHLVLYRRDPEQGRARFFSLMIERDLFGTIRLVRNWGFVAAPKGQEKVEIFSTSPRPGKRWKQGSSPATERPFGPVTILHKAPAGPRRPVPPPQSSYSAPRKPPAPVSTRLNNSQPT